MCEREYVGCGRCDASADHLSFWTENFVKEYAHVDDDGSLGDFYESSEPQESDSGYWCDVCECDVEISQECIPDECNCRECEPLEYLHDPDDPEEFVTILRRNFHARVPPDEEMPKEFRILNEDAAIIALPIRAERLAEIADYMDSAGITVDVSPVPQSIGMANKIPETETEALAA